MDYMKCKECKHCEIIYKGRMIFAVCNVKEQKWIDQIRECKRFNSKEVNE